MHTQSPEKATDVSDVTVSAHDDQVNNMIMKNRNSLSRAAASASDRPSFAHVSAAP